METLVEAHPAAGDVLPSVARLAASDVVLDALLDWDVAYGEAHPWWRALVESALKLQVWLGGECEQMGGRVREAGGLLVVGTGVFESRRIE